MIKFKGSIAKNWFKYWKTVYYDYGDVIMEIYKDCKEYPAKASVFVMSAGCTYYCWRHNPDEVFFRQQLIENTSKLIQTGEAIRNPMSLYHLKWLQQCYNEGIIRRVNLGIISFLWLDNYSNDCMLYKAVCPYLGVQILTFPYRIIDIGFLDNWWKLKNKMINYDINDEEFQNERNINNES